MSDKITSKNLDKVIEKNQTIKREITRLVNQTKLQYNSAIVQSANKFAFKILKENHLIQLPIKDDHFGGLIFSKNQLKIPVINTAQPRVYQYFVAWHEVYHLLYDENVSATTYKINIDLEINERMADYFAAEMILGDVYKYYYSLDDDTFLDRIMRCMDTFEAPYKVILIKLYEESMISYNNLDMQKNIKDHFDSPPLDIAKEFERLGLDAELVKPSYVFDVGELEKTIVKKINNNPDVTYHESNYRHYLNIKHNIRNIVEDLLNDSRKY